jgi:hypothetical protein
MQFGSISTQFFSKPANEFPLTDAVIAVKSQDTWYFLGFSSDLVRVRMRIRPLKCTFTLNL